MCTIAVFTSGLLGYEGRTGSRPWYRRVERGQTWTVTPPRARIASVRISSAATSAPGHRTQRVTLPCTRAPAPITDETTRPSISAPGSISDGVIEEPILVVAAV